MKLAEALQERADLNRRIQQLQQRLDNNAMVQEGEAPAEDPAELLKELNGCVEHLERIIARINLTNCRAEVEGGSCKSRWTGWPRSCACWTIPSRRPTGPRS